MFALVPQFVPVLLSLLVFDLHGTFVSMFIVSTFLFWCESQLKAAVQQDEARSRRLSLLERVGAEWRGEPPPSG